MHGKLLRTADPGMKPFGYIKIEIIHSHDLGE